MEAVMEGKPNIELPESLRTEKMAQTWTDYVEHRRLKRAKITSLAAKLIFEKFAKWGADKSVQSMLNSIENGWTGIFEPKNFRSKAQQVNGAGRIYQSDETTKAKLARETAIVKMFNEMDLTEQDVLLAEYRRLSSANVNASHFHRGFREWAYDLKQREA